MRRRLTRLAPGGSAIPSAALWRALRETRPAEALRSGLSQRLGAEVVTLHASGREALRVAFRHLAELTGRKEVIVPAYACYSIPAAAVAAGLEVRLVDVDARGRLDTGALVRAPLERAAALVIANLFGVPEPVARACELARAAGVALIDDAAQSLGAHTDEGAVGARGHAGVLSFGRAKPLSALGGGALVWPQRPAGAPPCGGADAPRRLRGLLHAALYDAAREPHVFRALSAIPALGIGTTEYDPGFRRGAMAGASVSLAAGLLPELERANDRRARRAEQLASRLRAETAFAPLLADPGSRGIYPRLGVLAPTASARDRALRALAPLGATAMYPDTLDHVDALRPHLAGDPACPGAHDFCARLLTLPTHAGLRERRLPALIRALREAAA